MESLGGRGEVSDYVAEVVGEVIAGEDFVDDGVMLEEAAFWEV